MAFDLHWDHLPRDIIKAGWKARQARWDAESAALVAQRVELEYQAAVVKWKKGPVTFSEVACEMSPAGRCLYDAAHLCVFCSVARENPLTYF